MGKKEAILLYKAKTLPNSPGCYLFKRKDEEILYIGKAKNLKKRVSSYFNAGAKTPKTKILVSHIKDFDFILTKTEAEAYILENNLIKKHSPKYNIRLKDDKSYPYIMVDKSEPFARPVYTRRPKRKRSSTVFGPFTTGSNISEVLRILIKSFGLRDCTLSEFKRRKRPCLLYQMKQCSASCVGNIDESEYAKDLDLVTSFFKGNGKKVLKELKKRMYQAAEREEFEYAAMVRDHLEILEDFCSRSIEQNVDVGIERHLDVIAFEVGEIEMDISIYIMRGGILLGHKTYHFQKGDNDEENKEIFMSFILQYYMNSHESLPKKVILDLKKSDIALVEQGLCETLKNKISVSLPTKTFKNIHELTKGHAKESQRFRLKNQQSVYVGLEKLAELLKLKETPRLLECYDVAIWQGDSPTASQIVFHEGKPDKKYYRHYHLEKRPEDNNDFEMMKEVLRRRIPKGRLPDVFIVDGGKGQVSSFMEVLKDFEIDIPVVGIAKQRSGKGQSFKDVNVTSSEERLIIPNRLNPYILKKCPSLLRIVVQMRDEAHRFSRKLHHKGERDRIFNSWFSDIEGIGVVTLEKIQKRLDVSIEDFKSFTVEEIGRKFDIKISLAEKIKKKLSIDS